MLQRSIYISIFFAALVIAGITSCRKPLVYSNSNLTFSTDTVVFDTVFTTIGSTTKRFKLYNPENRTVNIEQVELMGGEASPFRINVDGLAGTHFTNLELEGGDSLFVFVEVTLDPNNQLNPLIIEDSVRFRTNGVDQYVNLAAWGQDAYFHYKDVNQTSTWPNDKPHVIYGFSAVDSAQTLTIQAGTNIYLHKNAILFVYKGSLQIEGQLGNEVTLQGDRLESFYDNVTGQYYGIYMQEALPSKINYCNIKNATAGIHLFSQNLNNPQYTLELTNTKVINSARYGLFLFTEQNLPKPYVRAENCIFAKSGFHSLFVLGGADFEINHCHLLGYATGGNQTPAVGIQNYYTNILQQVTYVRSIDQGEISNSVIFGNLDQEIAIDTLDPDNNLTFALNFHDNHIRYEEPPTGDALYSNNTYNDEPLFISLDQDDYYFWSQSPLNNTANPAFPNILLPSAGIGIKGYSRLATPDKGPFERQ